MSEEPQERGHCEVRQIKSGCCRRFRPVTQVKRTSQEAGRYIKKIKGRERHPLIFSFRVFWFFFSVFLTNVKRLRTTQFLGLTGAPGFCTTAKRSELELFVSNTWWPKRDQSHLNSHFPPSGKGRSISLQISNCLTPRKYFFFPSETGWDTIEQWCRVGSVKSI